MNRALVAGLWVALGCTDKDPTTDTDTTETTETGTHSGDSGDSADSGTTTEPTPTPVIVAASALCDKADKVTLYVEANGWVAGAMMFMQETGNVAPQHTETQPIDSTYVDTAGDLEKLSSTLFTGTKFVARESTVFTCAGHFAAKGVMTYIAVIFDQDTNQPIDCFAFGADPQGLIDGKYKGTNPPPPPVQTMIDAGKCTIGTNVVSPL